MGLAPQVGMDELDRRTQEVYVTNAHLMPICFASTLVTSGAGISSGIDAARIDAMGLRLESPWLLVATT